MQAMMKPSTRTPSSRPSSIANSSCKSESTHVVGSLASLPLIASCNVIAFARVDACPNVIFAETPRAPSTRSRNVFGVPISGAVMHVRDVLASAVTCAWVRPRFSIT
jgi:hypothetical protein